MMNKAFMRGISSLLAVFMAIALCISAVADEYEGFVNERLRETEDSITVTSETAYYKTAFTDDGIPSDEGMAALIAAEDAHNMQAMEESVVLVLNNGALPLDAESEGNVTLLGRAVADPVYRCGSAGPSIDEKRLVTFHDAIVDAGFSVNQEVYDAYGTSTTARKSNGSDVSIGEENISFYTSTLRKSFSQYGDAAIILLSRKGGEGNDMLYETANTTSQLSLQPEEADLLKMVKEQKDAGVFKKVIVLINSAYAMELEWIYEEAYGVDACLWIGNPGLTGFEGVANVLAGKANPSGHFVDTYAADSMSAPATQNAGDITAADGVSKYYVQAEGIYLGYKYYETRYEDLILNRHNASSEAGVFASAQGAWNYAEEITFPFGYGLSYTTFEQKLDSVEWDDNTNTITATVTVTNTGSVAGKDAVQLYAQTPYTQYDMEHFVEKSAIQLLDFAKTKMLEPGESETLTITADKYLLASWDSTAHEGKGGYILDNGDYYIAIGNDVHDALNNILAAKGAEGMYDETGVEVAGNAANAVVHKMASFDDTTYQYSEHTGEEVVNRFNTELYAVDYNYFYPGTVTYLTRQDWNTFPVVYDGLEISQRMRQIQAGEYYDEIKPDRTASISASSLEADKGIRFFDMKDVPWEDEEAWNTFLMQMSLADLASATDDSTGQKAIESVGKPKISVADGPDGGSASYKYGDRGNNTVYVNEGTLACSWNKELWHDRGAYMAEDALYNATSAIYGPGADIHRTPFSGRNHEYYSECSLMSYLCAAVECKAIQDGGCVAALKHICANDQETNRSAVMTFGTEQALRQGSMKPFEGAMTKGTAMGAMCGLNSIGACSAARNAALLTDCVRGEWGYKGFIITDAKSCFETPEVTLAAGTDVFCLVNDQRKAYIEAVKVGDEFVLEDLLQTNKRLYYTYLHSNLINGLTATQEPEVSNTSSWWQTALKLLDIVLGVLVLISTSIYFCLLIREKRTGVSGCRKKVSERVKKMGILMWVYYFSLMLLFIADIAFFALNGKDQTFTIGCFIAVIAAFVFGIIGLITGFDCARWFTIVTLGIANAFHWYKGLPSLSDWWNGVNFIGGNQEAVIAFGSILVLVTVIAIIVNFTEERRPKIQEVE